ncbi:DNA polymerase III subunit delta' [Spiribacter sp. 1M153]|uniref:DNA polymerase III subunit delta' n=1 Tax=Spiribacter roseus TaxID=1855875 RepID=UPI00349FC9E1
MTEPAGVDAHTTRPMPWQQRAWERFAASIEANRVPHAVLLGGPAGTGKRALAEAMAARLLCSQPVDTRACDDCRDCRLRRAGSHPDYQIVEPAEGGSGILKIEATRALTEFSHHTSQHNRRRVVVLTPAEAMNRHAANALLKTLEEPPDGMVLILVSHQPGRLSATIRSRCQYERLGIPPQASARTWLQAQGVSTPEALLALAGGSPLTARQLAAEKGMQRFEALAAALAAVIQGHQSAVAAATDWRPVGALETTRLMQQLAIQLMRGATDPRQRLSGHPALEGLQTLLDGARLARIQGDLLPLREAAEQPLSRELSIEALFLTWRRP